MHFWVSCMGTMTLILLGNGVVAVRVAEGLVRGERRAGSSSRRGGGLRCSARVLVALAVGSNAHLNPAITIGVSIVQRRLEPSGRVHVGPDARRAARRGAGVLHYFQLWAGTDEPGREARVLLHVAGDSAHARRICSARSSARSCSSSSPRRSRRTISRRTGSRPASGRFWSACSSGASACRSAARPATRSIRRATSGPRIAHALLPIPGKGGSAWDYAPIPIARADHRCRARGIGGRRDPHLVPEEREFARRASRLVVFGALTAR